VQRVKSARVEVEGNVVGAIDRGLLVYLGFGRGDTDADRVWMLSKIVNLRIFEDEAAVPRKMTLSVLDVGGALLLVSQFTLYGDLRRGRRPSFEGAMPPAEAQSAYEAAVREARAKVARVETGRFQADMQVHAINDGPVTLFIDSAIDSANSPARAPDASRGGSTTRSAPRDG
jgi:D-tyrosyl-tRNA(Tyr) deacylase